MRFDIVTLFPEALCEMLELGVTGKAFEKGLAEKHCWTPRDWTRDTHRTVDDRPYGGGPGMVMKIEPLRECLDAVKAEDERKAEVICLSPQGQKLDQSLVNELAQKERLIMICGRYEGIDERFLQTEVDLEISIGDYVLSGGELAAAVLTDSLLRQVPGVLGDANSASEDSFADGLLDCPHYTRPESDAAGDVPAVLLKGHHAEIARWRKKQSLGRTWLRRPDLLEKVTLQDEDLTLLEEFKREYNRPGADETGKSHE